MISRVRNLIIIVTLFSLLTGCNSKPSVNENEIIQIIGEIKYEHVIPSYYSSTREWYPLKEVATISDFVKTDGKLKDDKYIMWGTVNIKFNKTMYLYGFESPGTLSDRKEFEHCTKFNPAESYSVKVKATYFKTENGWGSPYMEIPLVVSIYEN